MRILVTGSREWTDREVIRLALFYALGDRVESEVSVVIHGNATGADTLVQDLVGPWAAKLKNWEVESYPARWDLYGKKAGPLRNAQMLTEGKPDICLAFPLPGSKGTWDMIRKANAAGIEVRIIPPSKGD